MATAPKFAVRSALIVALGAAAMLPATAAAADFSFAPELQRLDLGTPHWDLSGATVWDDTVGAGRWAADRTLAPPVATPQEPASPLLFERIAFATPHPARTGAAVSYGAEFDGRITASGERFDMYRLTAASSELPLGSYVEVANLLTGERVTVRINDRRPTASGEVIALSFAAANRLGLDATPGAPVKVEYLGQVAQPASGLTQVASR
ncbi:MAG: septal ring lytic transglycosylase RlpA family protein [Phenylobacterium sp.]